MQSFLRSALLTSALAACVSLAVLADVALAQTKKYSHRKIRQGMFALSQIDSAAVVMLGDSLTEGAPWAEITGCRFLANRGIGGDDSAGVLKRLDGVTMLKPAAVFLMIGVNDVNSGVSTDTIVENVQEMLRKLKSSGTRVYLTLVLPVGENFKKINGKIDDLNQAYLKLAKEEQVPIVDFRADMRGADGFLKEELNRDGVHLTAEGYRVWRDALLPIVQRHCGKMDVTPAAKAQKPAGALKQVDEPPPAAPPAVEAAPAAAAVEGGFNTRFGRWR
jgi:lysophospholipase L1-like esterase